jgi:hypothetical protein
MTQDVLTSSGLAATVLPWQEVVRLFTGTRAGEPVKDSGSSEQAWNGAMIGTTSRK